MERRHTMRAARLHDIAKPLQVDHVAIPEPTGTDVLVRVKACGIVPNLKNVIHYFPIWFGDMLPLPPLPATYGLDPAGEIAKCGPDVHELTVGQRVYVNPVRVCNSCPRCRAGDPTTCSSYTFAGYFGFGPGSRQVFQRYPWGGFAEYMIAPASSLVLLPESVTYEQGARFGYLGTMYGALRRGEASVTTTVLINGATGTLGVGGVLLALAMGVPKIFAVARNKALLARIKQLAPDRIETFSTADGSTNEWVRALTKGVGIDVIVEALGPEATAAPTQEAISCLARGGRIVTVGGMKEKILIDPIWFLANQMSYLGWNWFSTAQGQDMASMAETGILDLSSLVHDVYSLEKVNDALDAARQRDNGGFTNVVVMP